MPHLLLLLCVHLHTRLLAGPSRPTGRAAAGGRASARSRPRGDAQRSSARHAPRALRSDHGQTTAEYALVLIGAAAVAVLLIGWATKTDRIGKLFDLVLDQVSGRAR